MVPILARYHVLLVLEMELNQKILFVILPYSKYLALVLLNAYSINEFYIMNSVNEFFIGGDISGRRATSAWFKCHRNYPRGETPARSRLDSSVQRV